MTLEHLAFLQQQANQRFFLPASMYSHTAGLSPALGQIFLTRKFIPPGADCLTLDEGASQGPFSLRPARDRIPNPGMLYRTHPSSAGDDSNTRLEFEPVRI